jgi:hypothetical protein
MAAVPIKVVAFCGWFHYKGLTFQKQARTAVKAEDVCHFMEEVQ